MGTGTFCCQLEVRCRGRSFTSLTWPLSLIRVWFSRFIVSWLPFTFTTWNGFGSKGGLVVDLFCLTITLSPSLIIFNFDLCLLFEWAFWRTLFISWCFLTSAISLVSVCGWNYGSLLWLLLLNLCRLLQNGWLLNNWSIADPWQDNVIHHHNLIFRIVHRIV